jgi:hypothetical protein
MNTIRDYFNAADTEVGQMIEGHYGWNEWCAEHALAHLGRGTSKGLNHRGIDVHEVVTSWREYRCYQCQKLLWSKENADGEPAIKDPFPAPKSGVIGQTPMIGSEYQA